MFNRDTIRITCTSNFFPLTHTYRREDIQVHILSSGAGLTFSTLPSPTVTSPTQSPVFRPQIATLPWLDRIYTLENPTEVFLKLSAIQG